MKNEFTTPILMAREIQKNPQQVYGWLRDGKIPEDAVAHDSVTGKPAIHRERFLDWYNNRQTKAGTVQVRIASNPDQILELLVGWMEKSGNKKLASDLQKVLDEMRPEQEQKQDEQAAV